MRLGLFIGSIIVLIVGFVLTITLIGAIIGVPLLMIGTVMAFVSIFVPNTRIDTIVYTQPKGEDKHNNKSDAKNAAHSTQNTQSTVISAVRNSNKNTKC